MERELAMFSLDDEEDEIVEVQRQVESTVNENEFCLVGCFLTASVIHFPTMRSTMANLLHPIKRKDLERVINGVPWTFNNNLLVFHRLVIGEDPLKLLARQLGDFIRKFMEYDSVSIGRGLMSYMRVWICLDVRHPLKRKKKLMFAHGNCAYVYFKYERLTLFCFFYGQLGHNDSFCQAMMALGVEVTELVWDLTLWDQS
ncbi:hypothetical protein Gohar_013545, partial [Gossypium harknessii]|nr:hypothetical protein [Gossypium harknessii]